MYACQQLPISLGSKAFDLAPSYAFRPLSHAWLTNVSQLAGTHVPAYNYIQTYIVVSVHKIGSHLNS